MIRIVCDGVEHAFTSLPVTIGRDADNDLQLEDSNLSRHHCRVCRTREGILLEDLDSSNGTYVNGARTRRHLLCGGDSILIGVTTLTMEWDPEAAPPPRKRRRTLEEIEGMEEENRRLKQLLGLVKTVTSESDEERLLRRILDSAIQLTGAAGGYLFLVTLHGLDFRAARDARGNDLQQPEDKISRSIAREAIETGRAVMTEDAGGDARFAGGQSVNLLNLRSVLCIPLKVPDGPIGALYLEQGDVTGQFHPRDIPFATAFGDFAAMTVATARAVVALEGREEQLKQSRARIGRLNARLKGLLRSQSRELAGVRADLDVSRQELGLRYDYDAIVGESPAMRKVLALMDRIIESELPVLIVGESGTGKELIARALHYNGKRREGRFVTVNCAAIPPELIEAELFGHEAGAYTGAEREAPGLFEAAHEGTLFLDEVGDMPLEVQSKLLRVLENGEVRRVGGTQVRQVSVRTVAASNRDPQELLKASRLREDLYYRLNGVTCPLPPLRERAEDIPALVDQFLDTFCAEQEVERPGVDPEVIDRLQAYPWPGNVRELRNEVQRLLALQRGAIAPDLLSLPVYSGDPEAVPPANLPPGGIKELVENLERRVLLDTMQRVNGNKTRAASVLGLSRLGLRKKLERYGLLS
ncbi:MAG: sigma 54-interacting transcriptional regulator [Planctomycetota bacterium]|jgi:transcriptional regulator with GAF, ATPase, and Fis domain